MKTTPTTGGDTMLNGLTEDETLATASVAGLSAGAVPELPVVATIERQHGGVATRWYHDASFQLERGMHTLTPHAPAQATIDELRAENERLTRERDEAVAEAKEIRARWNDAENELAALKSAQPVVDVEAVMRLAKAYALAQSNGTRSQLDAAREALRAALAGGRGKV